MKNKRNKLPIIKASISNQLFSNLEAMRYRIGISRSALIRMILSNKVEKLLKLFGQQEIDELIIS